VRETTPQDPYISVRGPVFIESSLPLSYDGANDAESLAMLPWRWSPGDKPESLVHDVTLLPRHAPSCEEGKVSPMCPEYGVTYVSGSTSF